MRKSRKTLQRQLDWRHWRQIKQGPQIPVENEVEAECDSKSGRKFFGCYLLSSLSPRQKGHSYIGFTVDPKRWIRQHNGEITSGAFTTKKKRPWEMVLVIHGFPDNVAAPQEELGHTFLKPAELHYYDCSTLHVFKWAWQHPKDSKAVREAAAGFKTLGGLGNKIKLALTMLTLPSWQSMNLTEAESSSMVQNATPEKLGRDGCIDVYDNENSFGNQFPILKNDLQATGHLAARVPIDSESNMDGHVTLSEETWAKDWKASFPIIKKHTEQIQQADVS